MNDEGELSTRLSSMRLLGWRDTVGGEQFWRTKEGAPATPRAIQHPEVSLIADLLVVRRDLVQSIECAEWLIGPEPQEDSTWVGAMFDSMIVAYGRCFRSGSTVQKKQQRRRLDHLVEALSSDDRDVHAEVLSLRDRQIGHRVDGQDRVAVLALFSAAGTFDRVTAISALLDADTAVARRLLGPATAILGAVEQMLHDETGLLETALRSMGVELVVD